MKNIRFNLGSINPRDGGPSVSGFAQVLAYERYKNLFRNAPMILDLENNTYDETSIDKNIQVNNWRCLDKPLRGMSFKRLRSLLSNRDELRVSTGSWKFFDLVSCLQLYLNRKLMLVLSPRGCFNSYQLGILKRILLLFYLITAWKTKRLFFHFLSDDEIQTTPKFFMIRLQKYSFTAMNTIDYKSLRNDFDVLQKTDYELGYFGRFIPEKNIEKLIRFAIKLNKTLLLCGPVSNYKKDLQEKYKNSAIMFIQPLYLKDKLRFFRRVKTVVLLSKSEGLPTSLLEAIYCNRSIICTEECNLPFEHELIGKVKLSELNLYSFKSVLQEVNNNIINGSRYDSSFRSNIGRDKFWPSLHKKLMRIE